jgi:hypothetical protein
MFKKELIKKFNEEQKCSSEDEHKPSPSDFAAGKAFPGILKRKCEDRQDTEQSKEHNYIQSKKVRINLEKNETKIIESPPHENIKIDYKGYDIIFEEHLKILKETVTEIGNRSVSGSENLQSMHNDVDIIADKMYNYSKEIKSQNFREDFLKLAADFVVDAAEFAITELSKLDRLIVKIKYTRMNKVNFVKENKIAVSLLDKNKVFSNEQEAVLSENIDIFRGLEKEIKDIVDDLSKLLHPTEIYNRSGFNIDNFQSICKDTDIIGDKMYNCSKEIKSQDFLQKFFALSTDFIVYKADEVLIDLEQLEKIKREVE